MLAAWDSAANGGDSPWALDLYFSCQNFNALPRSGGILDQDSYEMIAINNAAAAYFTGKKKMSEYGQDDRKMRFMIDILRFIRAGASVEALRQKLHKLSPKLIDKNRINTAVAERLGLGPIVDDIEGALNG